MRSHILPKLLGAALCLFLGLGILCCPASAADALTDADGDGHLEIGSAGDLYAFAALVNGGSTAIGGELTADITANEDLLTYGGQLNGDGFTPWTPIGSAAAPYQGSFLGNGYRVCGLYLKDDTARNVGFFGALGQQATVRQLEVTDCYFRGSQNIGGIAGINEGSLTDCCSTGTLSCQTSTVGGLIGSNSRGAVKNCYSVCAVSGPANVGSLVGLDDQGTVENSFCLSGDTDNGVGTCMTEEDFNAGKVAYLLGAAYGQNIDNNLPADPYPVLGGATVYCGFLTCIGINDQLYSNTPTSEMVAEHSYIRTRDDTYHYVVCAVCGEHIHTALHTFASVDNGDGTHTAICSASRCGLIGATEPHTSYENGFCVDCDSYEPAELRDGVYQIGNAGNLFWFSQLVNYGQTDACAVLTDHILIQSGVIGSADPDALRVWEPIGSIADFTGTLDGQGFSISGLYCSGSQTTMGLLRRSSGTVQNIQILDSVFSTTGNSAAVGGVVAINRGTVQHCFFDGTVRSTGTDPHLGGIVGINEATVRRCFALGTVSTGGGILGSCAQGAVAERCFSTNAPAIGSIASGSTVKEVRTLSSDAFRSGEAAWLLGRPFGQQLGTDLLPTLDAAAVYQVTDCQNATVYSNTNENSQHRYGADGICSLCQGAMPMIPTLSLAYPSLSFEEEIRYNIYYTAENTDDIVKMGLLTFDSRLENGTVNDATDRIEGCITDGTMYLASSKGISAPKLGDPVFFRVYALLTDGSYAYSEMQGYNAVTYAKTILNRSTSSAAMKSLVVAMLDYGAEAQRYFGHNVDSLMNASLTPDQQALIRSYDETMVDPVVAADSSKAASFLYDGSSFARRIPSVSFDGAFAINYYFTAAKTPDDGMTLYYWDLPTYGSVQELTADNATGSMQMLPTDTADQFWGQVPDIAAKELDRTVFVAGVYQHGGKTYTTGILSYSIGKYCEGLAAKDTSDQQSFAQMTAVYGYYAKTYFSSL